MSHHRIRRPLLSLHKCERNCVAILVDTEQQWKNIKQVTWLITLSLRAAGIYLLVVKWMFMFHFMKWKVTLGLWKCSVCTALGTCPSELLSSVVININLYIRFLLHCNTMYYDYYHYDYNNTPYYEYYCYCLLWVAEFSV